MWIFVLLKNVINTNMKYKYLDDEIIYDEKQCMALRFLYNTLCGRALLKVVTRKPVTKTAAVVMDSRISKVSINRFVKKHKINLEGCEEKKYKSFNDFFCRKLKTIDDTSDSEDFISTANSKISYYKISKELLINVKNSTYSIEELVKDKALAEEYRDGICLIYRLSPSNYHRYIYCDSGTQIRLKKIKGKFHTVNPIVYDRYKVFSENCREVTQLNTNHFGKIIQIEVGALCIGRIVNHDMLEYSKCAEKGYFEYGGSTIIHLIKKDVVDINEQIIENSKNNIETLVNIGDVIGKKHRSE